MVIFFSLLTALATLLGGVFALKQKDRLHIILGFSAGAILGVAFFDLMPEAIDLGSGRFGTNTMVMFVAAGFVLYLLLDRYLSLHACRDGEDCHNHNHSKGTVGATALSIHSFLDGAAIGLAFKVSPAVGAVVTAGVLAHDFSDGINTVSVVLRNNGNKRGAFRWLLVDAMTPAIGAISTIFFTLPADVLGIILALFAGFFLYLGSTDSLPESHHDHPTVWTTVATVLGMLVILLAVHFSSL